MSAGYHRQTAYRRGEMGGHFLDWSLQPDPFKHYLHRDPLPLPSPRPPGAPFFELALGWPPPAAPRDGEFDAADLAAVCLMAAGITSRGEAGLRAPASAGALYPAELYAVACEVPGLEDGLYHFTPQRPGLNLLWPGRLAGLAARCLASPPERLGFFVSAIFWRSLWKYRTRAYRYCLLDAGHLLANLELALAACGLEPLTRLDFLDRSAAVLLGLASDDEVALAAVQAGGSPRDPGQAEVCLPPLDLQARPLSRKVGRDPQVLAAHRQGDLERPVPPRRWLTPLPPRGLEPLPAPESPAEGPSLLEVVRRRRSRRNFLGLGLGLEAVSRLLKVALPRPGPCQATVLLAPGPDHPGGAFRYYPAEHALLPLGEDTRVRLGSACLGQLWVGRAALVLVLWADLEELTELGGPRAYRHAMLAAGRAGQRLYLGATALGLGCCGVGAFYDGEVARLAHLPRGAQPLYLLAAGPVKGFP